MQAITLLLICFSVCLLSLVGARISGNQHKADIIYLYMPRADQPVWLVDLNGGFTAPFRLSSSVNTKDVAIFQDHLLVAYADRLVWIDLITAKQHESALPSDFTALIPSQTQLLALSHTPRTDFTPQSTLYLWQNSAWQPIYATTKRIYGGDTLVWSHNGQWIAFAEFVEPCQDGSCANLVQIDLSTLSPTPAYVPIGSAYTVDTIAKLALHPDNTQLAVIFMQSEVMSLAILTLGTDQTRSHEISTDVEPIDIDWSADGQTFATREFGDFDYKTFIYRDMNGPIFQINLEDDMAYHARWVITKPVIDGFFVVFATKDVNDLNALNVRIDHFAAETRRYQTRFQHNYAMPRFVPSDPFDYSTKFMLGPVPRKQFSDERFIGLAVASLVAAGGLVWRTGRRNA